MFITVANKVEVIYNLLLDFSLLGLVISLNNLEVLNIVIKIFASIFIFLLAVVRLYFLLKEKKVGNNESIKRDSNKG